MTPALCHVTLQIVLACVCVFSLASRSQLVLAVILIGTIIICIKANCDKFHWNFNWNYKWNFIALIVNLSSLMISNC